MTKKAVLDIGSLKMKVSIFDVEKRELIASDSHLTLMGKGIEEMRKISDSSIAMLEEALQSVVASFKKDGISDVSIIGTEALRNAENKQQVMLLIEKYFPEHKLEIIDQHKEADLFFDAVSREFPDKVIVAMDIGGGSVQLIQGVYDSATDKVKIEDKRNLPTGTYKLQQKYSPKNDVVSTELDTANSVVRNEFDDVNLKAPILVFGSSVMKDFIASSGVVTEKDETNRHHPLYVSEGELKKLLDALRLLRPDARDHFFPSGGYFMYGADYLLFNLLAAIEKIQPERIYPTNINSSYAFI